MALPQSSYLPFLSVFASSVLVSFLPVSEAEVQDPAVEGPVTWYNKSIAIEARLVSKYEPFVAAYKNPQSEEYIAVETELVEQCGAIVIEKFVVVCELLLLKEGSVWAEMLVNVSGTKAVPVKILSPYRVEAELQRQVDAFRFVYLESDFETDHDDKKWQLKFALIVVILFAAVILFGVLYVPVNLWAEKRQEQKANEKPKPRLNRQLLSQAEMMAERRKEELRLAEEDAAREAAHKKADLLMQKKKEALEKRRRAEGYYDMEEARL